MNLEYDPLKGFFLKLGNTFYSVKKGYLTGKHRVFSSEYHYPIFECKNLEELEIWYNSALKNRKMELLQEIELINSQFSSEEISK